MKRRTLATTVAICFWFVCPTSFGAALQPLPESAFAVPTNLVDVKYGEYQNLLEAVNTCTDHSDLQHLSPMCKTLASRFEMALMSALVIVKNANSEAKRSGLKFQTICSKLMDEPISSENYARDRAAAMLTVAEWFRVASQMYPDVRAQPLHKLLYDGAVADSPCKEL